MFEILANLVSPTFRKFNSLSSISTQDSFLPALLFENTKFAFVS